jgi:hypothetical protein
LAGALACYLKVEANSFRRFVASIRATRAPAVAAALTGAHGRHADALAFVLATGRQSVRNRIAHYDFVSAGCINMSARGFSLVGGGESLSVPSGSERTTLGEVLSDRLDRLHACVDDMIDSFVGAARAAGETPD